MEGVDLGLCVYGIPFACGFAGRGTPRAHPKPLDTPAFMTLASTLDLRAVEVPPGGLPADAKPPAAADLKARAADLGLRVVIAGGRVADGTLAADLDFAAAAGARVLRCTLSGILCGDRRSIGLEGWEALLADAIGRLRAVAPKARDLGLAIAVENHQDATSADLLRLCAEAGEPVGVNLDTGNPLAVAEDPVAFATAILPHLHNVHLKDYRMVKSDAGFRLAHCPIGAGVVDYPALFALFRTRPGLCASIEMAALGERHIRLLENEWWAGYPPREAASLLPFFRTWRAREEEGEWQSPWDAGRDEGLAAWELDRLEESARRMTALAAAGVAA